MVEGPLVIYIEAIIHLSFQVNEIVIVKKFSFLLYTGKQCHSLLRNHYLENSVQGGPNSLHRYSYKPVYCVSGKIHIYTLFKQHPSTFSYTIYN